MPSHVMSQLYFFIICDYDFQSLDFEHLPEFFHTVLNYWKEFKPLTISEEKPTKQLFIYLLIYLLQELS